MAAIEFDATLAPMVGHVDDASVPWIEAVDHRYKLLRVERASGLRVLRVQLPPGFRAPRHRHSGSTIGFTISGAWGYEEYGTRYEGGCLIFEPSGSVHTLITFPDNDDVADVVFVSQGANTTLDDDGNVIGITDTQALLAGYYADCDRAGVARPTHIEA